MLPTSLLFLHTADADKNYNEELKLTSMKTFNGDFSTVSAICLLVSLLGVIGNGIIFWFLCCTIKKTKFIAYAANLALADFIEMLHLFFSCLEYFFPFLISSRMRQVMVMMFLFGHETNLYFLTTMSSERCLTVFSPVWYQTHRQKCPTPVICAFLWTMSVLLSVIEHFLCEYRYLFASDTAGVPCESAVIFYNTVVFIIFTPTMAFSTLAIFIRMKRHPEENLPARLDVTIFAMVVLYLIMRPAAEITGLIIFSMTLMYHVQFYSIFLIFYCMASSINPFIYLLVGSWKREKGQEPFFMFLERALRDERKDELRTQPDQEQA